MVITRVENIQKQGSKWVEECYKNYIAMVKKLTRVNKAKKKLSNKVPKFIDLDRIVEYKKLYWEDDNIAFKTDRDREYEVLTKQSFEMLFFNFLPLDVISMDDVEKEIEWKHSLKGKRVPFVIAGNRLYVENENKLEDWSEREIVNALVICSIFHVLRDGIYEVKMGKKKITNDFILWLNVYGFLPRREKDGELPEPKFARTKRSQAFSKIEEFYEGEEFRYLTEIDWNVYPYWVMVWSGDHYYRVRLDSVRVGGSLNHEIMSWNRIEDQYSDSVLLSVEGIGGWHVKSSEIAVIGEEEEKKGEKISVYVRETEEKIEVSTQPSFLDRDFKSRSDAYDVLEDLF